MCIPAGSSRNPSSGLASRRAPLRTFDLSSLNTTGMVHPDKMQAGRRAINSQKGAGKQALKANIVLVQPPEVPATATHPPSFLLGVAIVVLCCYVPILSLCRPNTMLCSPSLPPRECAQAPSTAPSGHFPRSLGVWGGFPAIAAARNTEPRNCVRHISSIRSNDPIDGTACVWLVECRKIQACPPHSWRVCHRSP